MKLSNKGPWIFGTAIFICFYWFNYLFMPYPICSIRMVSVSDEELIEKTLAKEEHQIKFGPNETISNYYQRHPNCCNVDRSATNMDINGLPRKVIIVTAKFELKEPLPSGTNGYIAITQLDPCGDLMTRTGIAEKMKIEDFN